MVQTLEAPRRRRRPLQIANPSKSRWNDILVASSRLFWERGFDATSIKDIGDAVGMLKGSLYYYIDTKEDLLVAILRGLHNDGEEIVAAVNFDAPHPLRELQHYLNKAVIFAGLNSERLAIFLHDFRKVPEEHRPLIIAERNMYVRTTQTLIESAQAKDIVPMTVDARVAAIAIMSAISGTHEWLRHSPELDLEQAAQQISGMLVFGLDHASSR